MQVATSLNILHTPSRDRLPDCTATTFMPGQQALRERFTASVGAHLCVHVKILGFCTISRRCKCRFGHASAHTQRRSYLASEPATCSSICDTAVAASASDQPFEYWFLRKVVSLSRSIGIPSCFASTQLVHANKLYGPALKANVFLCIRGAF